MPRIPDTTPSGEPGRHPGTPARFPSVPRPSHRRGGRAGRRSSGFLYLGDPVFLAAAAIYLANRLVLKPLTTGLAGPLHRLLHGYLNDILCIPFCLPPLLVLARSVGVRRHDGPPTRLEICVCLALWSAVFEWIAPRLPGSFPAATGDPRDVAAYAGGAIAAGLLWGTLRPAPLPPVRDGAAHRRGRSA